jgi:hypothetical protein
VRLLALALVMVACGDDPEPAAVDTVAALGQLCADQSRPLLAAIADQACEAEAECDTLTLPWACAASGCDGSFRIRHGGLSQRQYGLVAAVCGLLEDVRGSGGACSGLPIRCSSNFLDEARARCEIERASLLAYVAERRNCSTDADCARVGASCAGLPGGPGRRTVYEEPAFIELAGRAAARCALSSQEGQEGTTLTFCSMTLETFTYPCINGLCGGP